MRRAYYHHFEKSDSHMWINWVRHDGFGLRPRLCVNEKENGLFFFFRFTWWKLNSYWVKSIKNNNSKKR